MYAATVFPHQSAAAVAVRFIVATSATLIAKRKAEENRFFPSQGANERTRNG